MAKTRAVMNEDNRFILRTRDDHSSVIEFFFIMSVFTLIHFLNGLTKIILFNSIIKSKRKNFW